MIGNKRRQNKETKETMKELQKVRKQLFIENTLGKIRTLVQWKSLPGTETFCLNYKRVLTVVLFKSTDSHAYTRESKSTKGKGRLVNK